jgi:hypothetical protein
MNKRCHYVVRGAPATAFLCEVSNFGITLAKKYRTEQRALASRGKMQYPPIHMVYL